MSNRIAIALLALASAGAVMAQIQPKSKAEYEAILAIQNAATPDERIKACDALLAKFADTQFKSMALETAAASAQQKNDTDNMIIYAERALESNSSSYTAMFMLAQAWASRTKEFDLDKEEKLAKSEKMATEAIELAKVAPKPQAQIPDEQWELARKEYVAQGHEALGIAALARKKYDVAEQELQSSVAASMQVDPAILVRLGNAQGKNGKFDAAIATLDKAIADPQAVPIVKQAAQSEKAKIMAAKAAAAPKQ